MSVNPGVTFKLQFYPSNFFNEDYTAQDALGNDYKPYLGMDARLITFSLGFDIQYKKKPKVEMAKENAAPEEMEEGDSEE